jgi:hypothetical protein
MSVFCGSACEPRRARPQTHNNDDRINDEIREPLYSVMLSTSCSFMSAEELPTLMLT